MPTLEIDGVNLAYEERASGPPVLLVHGTGGAEWDPLPGMLAADNHVIYYHRRSFGPSTHPPLADLPRHTADAAALIEQLGGAPLTVVGHSMGGIVSIDLTVRRPDLVSRLVLVEPPLHFTQHPTEAMMSELGHAMQLREAEGDEAGAEYFMRWATTTTDGGCGYELAPPDVKERLLANSSAILKELEGGTGDYISADEVAAISCPVTLLVGELTLPEYWQAAERIKAANPAVELVTVPGAGHMLTATHPQVVVDAVARAPGLGDGGRGVDEGGEVPVG
ncbi:MAG TPA: alpha/beta hydrolase [Thermoleophilaceae bacterium]